MEYSAYRTKNCRLIQVLAIILLFIVISCDEDEKQEYLDPAINFVINQEYIDSDTTLSVGQTFKIGIHAESNGHYKLTNFIAMLNGERYMDLGMYKDIYERELEIIKSLEDIEEWEFIIRDFGGNSASIYVTIFKDPNITYGEINEFLNVEMGAQFNSGEGNFFSLTNGTVYDLEGAYNNSELIDIVYYFDDFDKLEENIIASPGANIGETAFPGEYAISNWETVNTTRYSREKLDVTTEEFDNASNDSILIANSFAFESGGRKTKFLKTGDIYSFVRGSRTGMFKVISTTGTNAGTIVVDIKIQK